MSSNIESLESIFDFFDHIISFYKDAKRDNRFNFKVPSQNDIGSAFGALGSNYSLYKKEKRLPNLWGKNVSKEYIIEDIYNRLYDGGFIPQENKYLSHFTEYMHNRILSGNNENLVNDSIIVFLKDLDYFSNINDFKNFIKSIIEYSNKNPDDIYKSRSFKYTGMILDEEFDVNIIEQNKKIKSYMKSLKKRIRKSDWYGKYIELRIKKVVFGIRNILDEVDDKELSIKDFESILTENNKLILLGNPGGGKSTALLKIVNECLNDNTDIPIYLELNQYKEESIEEFIYKYTGKKLSDENIDRCIFLFDGLDELPSDSKFMDNFKSDSYKFEDSKVICTSRINNFQYDEGNDFETFLISPMNKTEVVDFLKNEFDDKALEVYENLNIKIKELSTTPLLLVMIIRVLKYSDKFPSSLTELYEIFTEYLLNNFDNKRNDFLSCDKDKIFMELAYYIYFKKNANICSISKAQKIIINTLSDIGYNRLEQNLFYNEITLNGILKRKFDKMSIEISFSHQSFMEYYASKKIFEKIKSFDYEDIEDNLLESEILNFMKGFNLDWEYLENILHNMDVLKKKNYIQSNIVSLLHLKEFNFKEISLCGRYLPAVKLQNVNFSGCDLSDIILKGADLRGVNFTNTILRNADLSMSFLEGVSFTRGSIRSFVRIDNSNLLAYVGDINKVKLLDIDNGEIKKLGEHKNRVRKIDYNKVFKIIGTCSYDSEVGLWDLNGRLIDIHNYHNSPVLSIRFSQDGRFLVSGDSLGVLVLYDIKNKQMLFKEKIHEDSIRDLIFIDDENIITVSWDKTVKSFNLMTKEIFIVLKHQDYIFSVDYNKNNKVLISGGSDELIYLNDYLNKKTKILESGISMRSVRISNDGKYLIAAGKKGKVQIWKNEKLILEWTAHNMCIRNIDFITNDTIVSSGDDSKIKYWKLDYEENSATCTKEFVDEEISESGYKGINCKNLNIRGVKGLSHERIAWLKRNGAKD
jgi:WD40 repeat protein